MRISRAFSEKRLASELERQKTQMSAFFQEQIPEIRGKAVEQSRAVLSGKFAENLSPYLPGFGYFPDEARFLGNPVDFIVFEGASRGDVRNIVFVEVKSGGSKPTAVQKSIRRAVEEGRVKWELYRVPDRLVRGE
ncbi:MAG: hypothetical protein EHM28_06170 [Spirochaetaceae bacterium]|nr:MAG: hypothetical protein EHM28_06170 [Spirochaetaceae bacterium]